MKRIRLTMINCLKAQNVTSEKSKDVLIWAD